MRFLGAFSPFVFKKGTSGGIMGLLDVKHNRNLILTVILRGQPTLSDQRFAR